MQSAGVLVGEGGAIGQMPECLTGFMKQLAGARFAPSLLDVEVVDVTVGAVGISLEPTAQSDPAIRPPDQDISQYREGSTDDSLKLYLQDVRKHPLLTREDEVWLAQTYEVGQQAEAKLADAAQSRSVTETEFLVRQVWSGQEAQQRFINSNLRWVVKLAKRRIGSGMPLLDLIQEGNLGLMHAVDNFDWRRGYKFSTYSKHAIQLAITRGIYAKSSEIRLPFESRAEVRALLQAQQELAENLGCAPSARELMARLGWPEQKLNETQNSLHTQNLQYLDETLTDQSDSTRNDVVSDPDGETDFEAALTSVDLKNGLPQAMKLLDERERKIIELRFGLNGDEALTLPKASVLCNIPISTIQRIEQRALAKLRDSAELAGYAPSTLE